MITQSKREDISEFIRQKRNQEGIAIKDQDRKETEITPIGLGSNHTKKIAIQEEDQDLEILIIDTGIEMAEADHEISLHL